MEFWLIGQIIIDILLLLLFLYLIKTIKSLNSEHVSDKTVGKLTEAMEPLLRDAEKVAEEFDSRLKEKHRLVRKLNESLDDRIISLNLLLNRAELYIEEFQGKNKGASFKPHVIDQQKEIILLAQKGLDPERIAKRISISIEEVELVLDLKKKFLQMEAGGHLP